MIDKKLLLIALLAMSALLSGCALNPGAGYSGPFIRTDFIATNPECQGGNWVKNSSCQHGVNEAVTDINEATQAKINSLARRYERICYDATYVDDRGRVFFTQPKIPDRREFGIACADGRKRAWYEKTRDRASDAGWLDRETEEARGRIIGSSDTIPATASKPKPKPKPN